jgi:hypothetical protein
VLVGGITGTFTMTGGGIFNNVVTTGNGGGVFVEGYSGGPSAFNMTGGTIGGNAVTGNGGGVYVATNGIFTKTGTGSSIIYGDTNATHTSGSNENTAGSDHGHAVYVESGSQERNDNADFSVSLNSDTSDNWE